jgi:hypothetical protein
MNKLTITADQIKDSPKKIGRSKTGDVFFLRTKGGLALIMQKSVNGSRVIGLANHPAIAKHMAQESDPTLVIDELSKSEQLPLATFQALLPTWYSFMNEVNLKLDA